MNKKIVDNKFKYQGFTAFELIGVLVVFTFLILLTNKIISNINKAREYNQLADQGRVFSQIAIKYIEDNYRDVVTQTSINNLVIPYDVMISHTPQNISLMTRFDLVPCVYVTSDDNDQNIKQIRAYILFGNSGSAKRLTELDVATVAHGIGANAGVLVHNSNGEYKFKGGIENDLVFSSATMNNIKTGCKFNQLANNSLIIDLSKDRTLFNSIKGDIDKQFTSNEKDPTLQKAQNINMQTNIYLDNVYKESSSTLNYYCDAAKLNIADANNMCQKFATNNNYFLYSGSAIWVSSVLTSGNKCQIKASGKFYQMAPSCNGVSLDNAANYCPQTLNNKTIVPGSGVWSPTIPKLENGKCVSTAQAYYRSAPSCFYRGNINGQSEYYDYLKPVCANASQSPLMQLTPCANPTGNGYYYYPDFQGVYNSATGKCTIKNLSCNTSPICIVGSIRVDGEASPVAGDTGQQDPSPTACGQISVPVNNSQTDLGTVDCGTELIEPIQDTTNIPAQHIYRAIDYGNSPISGQRIQVKSDAPAGATSQTSKLLVNSAGLQSGLISPVSHSNTAGSKCSASELGKLLQDMNSVTIKSQVQCTYNPTFCPGDGYCFLPIKNTTFDFSFSTPQASYNCPTGTVVDANQPADNIDPAADCAVKGEAVGCYIGATGMTFCQGYQTVCNVGQGKQLVDALIKLRCTNSTTTYLVDNYTRK